MKYTRCFPWSLLELNFFLLLASWLHLEPLKAGGHTPLLAAWLLLGISEHMVLTTNAIARFLGSPSSELYFDGIWIAGLSAMIECELCSCAALKKQCFREDPGNTLMLSHKLWTTFKREKRKTTHVSDHILDGQCQYQEWTAHFPPSLLCPILQPIYLSSQNLGYWQTSLTWSK